MTDAGLMCVAGLGELEKVIARACAGISDRGIQRSVYTVFNVTHITNCIEMALRKNWHYACICGHHMLPKFATVFLLLLSSSVMLEKVCWRLWVSITDT